MSVMWTRMSQRVNRIRCVEIGFMNVSKTIGVVYFSGSSLVYAPKFGLALSRDCYSPGGSLSSFFWSVDVLVGFVEKAFNHPTRGGTQLFALRTLRDYPILTSPVKSSNRDMANCSEVYFLH